MDEGVQKSLGVRFSGPGQNFTTGENALKFGVIVHKLSSNYSKFQENYRKMKLSEKFPFSRVICEEYL